ncbi:MAG: pyrroline-5-carboxylate reductase [Parvularculaceae bacterium]|nr:pyrroline-5-carboxylate reductase [Parvularculaceae bacterium]
MSEPPTSLRPAVALVGAGAMGAALLKGWIAKGAIAAARSAVFDPAISESAVATAAGGGVSVNPPLTERFDVLVLAIKPQSLSGLEGYAPIARSALVISVLAGKSIASVAAALGGAPRVIRAMPNLPSMLGAGVSGLFAPPALSAHDRSTAQALMEAAGAAVYVESEAAIDAVTAISGSGPAYFFLMAEALEEAARALGLPLETARLLARQTLAGAGAVIASDAREASALRKAVTSPGGTTEAALRVLDGDAQAVRKLMKDAAQAAVIRARELTS